MNWRQIKKIFIVLFLCTNVMLIIFSCYTHYAKTVIPKELTLSMAQVLENNGIHADAQIIPNRKLAVVSLMTVDAPQREEKLVKEILGGSENITLSEGVYIMRDGRYLAFGNGCEVYCGNLPVSGDKFAAAKDFVSKLNTKASDSYVISRDDASGTYVFGQMIDKKVCEGSSLTVRVSAGKLGAKGIYIYAPVMPISDEFYTDPMNAIMELISKIDAGEVITSIEPCFVMERSMFQATLVPAYAVECESGKAVYIDCMTGEKLAQKNLFE